MSRARDVSYRLRRRLAAAGSFGTLAARAVVGLLSGWRPLVLFWVCVLAVLAAGGAVLHGLGPPPEVSAERHARRGVEARAAPASPVPAFALLAAPPAAPGAAPAPTPIAAPGRPPPDARADGDAAREEAGAGPGAGATDRAEAPPQPGNRVLLVVHSPKPETGTTVAQHLAARAGIEDDRVTTEPISDPPARAIIRFYAAADHPLARRLGRELAQLGYAWQIENLSARPPPGRQAVEVWLPNR